MLSKSVMAKADIHGPLSRSARSPAMHGPLKACPTVAVPGFSTSRKGAMCGTVEIMPIKSAQQDQRANLDVKQNHYPSMRPRRGSRAAQ
jgi:hypothetical protein